MSLNSHLNIQDWAIADRPREKLVSQGATSLTDAELLATLIGSGTKDTSVVLLAQQILRSNNHSLQELAKRSVQDLKQFKGIGMAKAITIVCAMELTRRRWKEKHRKPVEIRSPKQIYDLMQPELMDKPVEEFWVILLNKANYVIKKMQMSTGGLSATIADRTWVFKWVLSYGATALALVHNHPSGDARPSRADIDLTTSFIEAGKILGISVIDHIIFTNNGYFSFANAGLLSSVSN